MRFGLRAVGSSCYQVFSHVGSSFGGNVLAMLLSLPIVVVTIVAAFAVHSLSLVPLGIALLVGALPNPACMGLHTLARELARGQTADLREQWHGLRTYWRVSLKAWSLAAVVAGVCVLNMAFYGTQAAHRAAHLHAVAAPLFVAWALVLFVWLGINMYVAPLLLAQDEARVLLAYRNAAVVMVSRPVAGVIVCLLWLATLVFTSATGLATVIGLALAAAIQQNAFRLSLPSLLPSPAGQTQ